MAVGIEERMVPHMENKKQDCKKIEELKRQYAGSEMSGEQVEQMKKRIEEAKMEKRNESRKMHTVRNIVAAAAAVAAVFVVLPNTSGSVAYAHGESTGGRKTRGGCDVPGLSVRQRRSCGGH